MTIGKGERSMWNEVTRSNGVREHSVIIAEKGK
jgi:hypothetical protein